MNKTTLKIIESRDAKLIKDFISVKKKHDKYFSNFIEGLSKAGKIFIVGGGVRDIINNNEVDDLDIIIKLRKEKLSKLIFDLQCNYKTNKFGGYKIYFSAIVVDIWSIDDNWAFKENVLSKKVSNISKSTFFNFDSLVCNLYNEKVYSHYYNECIRTRVLDIIIRKEDYLTKAYLPEAIVIKAFTLKVIYDLEFSDAVKTYIQNFIDNDTNAIRKIFGYSTKEYRKNIMENLSIETFEKSLKTYLDHR